MKKRFGQWAPVFNRFVAFSTASDTMHGNPEPVNHPDGLSRRSLALYHYTATWDDSRQKNSTIFRDALAQKMPLACLTSLTAYSTIFCLQS
jgi:hypothetical protein